MSLRQPETGESSAQMAERHNNETWCQVVRPELEKGAHLVKLLNSVARYYLPDGRGGLSASYCARLEREGKIRLVGAHKYALAAAALSLLLLAGCGASPNSPEDVRVRCWSSAPTAHGDSIYEIPCN